MWIILGAGFIIIIALLFIIMICFMRTNEKRIYGLEKRQMAQDVVIEKLYTTLLQIVDRQKIIEGKLKHYLKV